LSPSAPESLTSIDRNETTDFDITAETDIPNDGFAKRVSGVSALSPPMLLIASSTFWPSARTPRTTRSEIEVALRSSRTRNDGAVEDQAHDRLLGQQAGVHYGRNVHCKNISTWDITITRMRCRPAGVNLASGTTLNAIAAASIGDGFIAILKADQERELPLIFNRGELLNEDSKDLAPFVMTVSWRRNSSYWLPQIPKVIFSSARAMRALKSAK
jgi:hypothetical protein